MKAFNVGCVLAVLGLCQISEIRSAKVPSLPNSIEMCKRNDDVCLFKSSQIAMKALKNGIPKIGMFPIDPLQVTELRIKQGGGSVSADLIFTDQLLGGVSDVIFKSVKGEFTDTSFHFMLRGDLPSLTLNGNYTVNGKVLILPIRGAGKNAISLNDVDASIDMKGHIIQKGGEDYVQIDKLVLTLNVVKRLRIHLSNLFNGDKALGDNMNKFLDDNWELVWDELRTSFEIALGDVFQDIANRIYSKIPYKNLHVTK